MKAMVFAAGLGTRLRPITDNCPKALVEVGGIPMLQRVLEKIRDAGIYEVVVNVHHFPDMIIDFINVHHGFGVNVRISDERDSLLDTGGGIAYAFSELNNDDEPVLVHNADILTDFPLEDMIRAHHELDSDVTLLAQARMTSRYLLFDADGRMRGWTNRLTGKVCPDGLDTAFLRNMAFGGVHVLSSKAIDDVVRFASQVTKFSITSYYISRCNDLRINAYLPSEPYNWIDVGRPESLIKANSLFTKSE